MKKQTVGLRGETVVSLFRKTAKVYADKNSVTYAGKSLTYAQFDEYTDNIAAKLVSLFGETGETETQPVVGILTGRSEYMPLSMMGAAKSGAVYLPLDPSYPNDRLEFMLADSGAKFLIADRDLVSKVEGAVAREDIILLFTDEIYSLPKAGASIVSHAPKPEDLITLIYTSGTTGAPKGTKMHHAGVLHFVNWYRKETGTIAGDNTAAYFSCGFIAHTMDLYSPLIAGACMHVIPTEMRLNLPKLKEYYEKNNIAKAALTAQVARQVVLNYLPKTLRVLLIGSEAAVPFEPPKGLKLVNMYGMTETSLAATSFVIDKLYDKVPIGKPIEDTLVYILDEQGNLAPEGAVGELAVAGVQVSGGYIGRDELTAERFIKNPFSDDPAYARMYKTGDLARLLDDGNLEYIGRSDFQVKISGFRVELPEIERRMREYPGITNAVAVGADAPSGGKRILAYIVSDETVDIAALNAFVEEKLPPYMVPSGTMQLEKLPLNQNGKLDRKALPKIEIADEDAVFARSEREKIVAAVFEEIMGLGKIGVTSDLLKLGLNSLTSISAAAKISDRFGVELSAPQIMRERTIEKVAALISGETDEAHDAASAAESRTSFPLTKNQLGIYFACAADPDDLVYNIPCEIKFSSAVNADILADSAIAVVNAHPYLKTRLEETGGETRQIKSYGRSATVTKTNCTDDEYAVVKKNFIRPFNLLGGDLYRIEIYKTDTAVYILCDFHHIIFDGSSMGIFMRDLARAYAGEKLETEKYTAFDVSLAEEALEDGAKYRKAKKFFENLIGDGEGASPLPFEKDEARSGVGTEIASIDCSKVDGTIRGLGVTAANVFMAAAALAVSRYAPDGVFEDNSLRIASLNRGREGSKTQSSVGMFVKTLPTVIDMAGEKTLSEYILAVQDRMLATIENQAYSYMTASSEFAYNAQIAYGYQAGLVDEQIFEGEACNPIQAPFDRAKFPISIAVNKDGETYLVQLEYDKALFEDFYIKNLADSIVYTAKSFAENLDTRVSDISVTTPEQTRRILEDFAGVKSDEVRGETIVSLFRKTAQTYGGKNAVVFAGKSLTYAQFDEYTDNLAAKLVSLYGETSSQPIVGILTDRNEYMPLSMLGVMKSGAAYLPLDPSYPTDRLEYMLTDSGAKIVIADRGLATKIENATLSNDVTLVYTDEIYSLPKADSAVLAHAPKPEDLITLIYTSGTTGKPKGTMVHHAGVVNFVNWYKKAIEITPDDNATSYIACGFDPHMQDLYSALTSGACLHVIPEEMRLNLPEMKDYFERNNITKSCMPTQMGRQFIMNYLPGTLKAFSVGGEALMPFEPPEGLKFFNLYGPTETSIGVTGFIVDKLYPKLPIGKAIDNTALYIIDKQGHLAPPGVAGELAVAGVQVTNGYLGREELTAEKFVKNPFSSDPAYSKIYKTGDLARFLDDGNVDFIGRRDFQVKIRGFRVELPEIERRIREYPGITNAAVIAADAPGGGKRILAYIVADEAVDIAALNTFIEEKLPPYMVPSGTAQLDKLPLNQNGKLDRKALPEIAVVDAENTPPGNDLERMISDIIAEIMGVGSIGVLTSLAQAGLDSLSAIRAAAQISDKTGVGISAPKIMKAKTIRKLAELLAAKGVATGAQAAPTEQSIQPAVTAKTRQFAPLTNNQLGIYFACCACPGAVTYNIPAEIKFGAKTDARKLSDAAAKVINAHPYIKTRLEESGGQPRQYVLSEEPAKVEYRECSEAEYSAAKQSFVRPFELIGGRLYRIEVIKTEERVYMLYDFHHIIFDGVSAGIFLTELAEAYGGKAPANEAHSAFELALLEQDEAKGESYAEAKAFFENLIGDGEGASQISSDNISSQSGVRTVKSRVSRESVENAIRDFDATPANFFLAAAALTLSLYAPSAQVVGKSLRIASASSGRESTLYQNSFGMFVKTLPTVIDIAPELGAAAYICAVSDRMFETIDNQIYPYMQAASDFGYSSQVMFAYQGGLMGELKLDGEPFEMSGLGLSDPKFPLTIFANTEGSDYTFELEYDRACFEDFYIDNLAESMACVAKRLAESPYQRLGEISAATPEQRRQVLEDFAGRKTDEVLGLTVVDMFRDIAARMPEHVAVVSGNRRLSYAELDAETDRITAYLASVNTGKSPIAIMVGRSENMPIFALAALKSGAPYMPLDPGYPTDRLRFMLSDSGAAVLISDRGLDTDENGDTHFPEFDGKKLYTDDLRRGEFGKTLALPESPTPDDRFILLYTSGTTGNPKGALLPHRSVVNFINWYNHNCKLTKTDVVPAYASFGFDANMMDMYSALTTGACLHIVPEEMRLDLPAIASYYEENGVTVAFLTTQIARQFVEMGRYGSLRVLGTGGETMLPSNPPEGLELNNLYGPTETTVAVAALKVDKYYSRVPIGRALDNTALYIVDKNGNLAPAGAFGELTIAGRQVGLGYLNRPELTSEKFVKNPFSDDPEYATMYRTGDLARFLPDGNVDFIGRSDFQVKIRGFRVELTEIEARIREYPPIKDAAVIASNAPGGGKRILAYIVSDETVDIAALNAFIEEKLPYYMVPAGTKQLERIPINRNGKVNRKELPEIQSADSAEAVPPSTDTERLVAEVVSGIMGESNIGINLNLMQSGLDSLSAIRVAAKISEKASVNISAPQIMKAKTIESIAALLDGVIPASGRSFPDNAPDESAAPAVSYPLTANQLGVYFACVKDPGSLAYNVPFEMKFPKGISAERLKQSAEAVINAHSYIKTRLVLENTQPRQKRLDDEPAEVELINCTESEFGMLRREFVKPFGLFEGNLYRISVCDTGGSVHMLCDFHHIVFDGGSLEIFMSDLSRAYDGAELESETFTSFDYALLEEKRSGGAAFEKSKSFFAGLLATLGGTTALPENQGTRTGKAAQVHVKISRAVIDGAIKGRGITAANHFLAATALAAGRFASSAEKLPGEKEGLRVALASINSGRDDMRLQSNFGMLVQTLPTIIDIPADSSAEAFTAAVQERMLETFDSRFYPYMRVTSDYGYNPQIMYAFQGGVLTEHRLAGQPFSLEPLTLSFIKFPINITISVDGGDYGIVVEYDDSKFTLPFIHTFAESIAACAVKLAEPATPPVREISVCSPNQLRIAEGFGRRFGTTAPPEFSSLAEMFEASAGRNPSKTALVASGESYTFKQLELKANALANSLLKRGVVKGDRVAFMLPRTAGVIVSMLGIVKAGACYIPIDPEYPQERIAHILSDSGAKLLITAELYGELMECGDSAKPRVEIAASDPCYIIYTSGSTGLPKGVVIPHGGIVNYCLDVPENRHVRSLTDADATMVSVTTVSFDMFLKEAFTTLMNGLTLVLANDDEAKEPKKLAQLFKQSGGNAFNATPSRMLGYLELPEFADAIKGCKVVMAGGEKYPAALYKKLRSLTDAVLINTYGPTETTVSCNGKILGGGAVTVGAPMHGVIEAVMDIYGNPLPVGVTGQLYIGGAGLALGYFGDTAKTDAAFVDVDGERYYKSGDLARWTDSGEIEILGRNDGQIKLRGLRIELGEIENRLSSIDGVDSCAVLVRKIRGQEHLAAYYTAARVIAPEELRDALSLSLTKYMVPTAYLQIERFPVTPNGKTDLKALPEPKLLQSEDYEPPANAAEADFCEIFAAVLGLERVGVNDSFFAIGGTSLLVTMLTIGAMKKGYEISYGEVFANPTPRSLAEICGKTGEALAENAENSKAAPPVSARGNIDIGGDGFDYTAINARLGENTIASLIKGQKRELGNICLTGATGFLGVHVLYEFLKSERGAAYCIVRGGKSDCVKRLKSRLVYYFSNGFDELFGSRIVVIEGDVTSFEVFDKLKALPIDTLINCAANVKHFSAGTDIEDVNIGGVRGAVDYCKQTGARLIHISTASIAGMSVDGSPPADTVLNEQMLWFGQDISNKYVSSKFMAERLILAACASDGLDAKIMRVGNLMARASDGEFQANFSSNSFLGRLKGYSIVGRIPYETMGQSTEFAPIDCTADAILRLAKTPKECRVFHPYNDHEIFIGDAIKALGSIGINIQPSDLCEYSAAFNEAMMDSSKAKDLRSLIAYSVRGREIASLKSENNYTSQALLRYGFMWPITSLEYLDNFFKFVARLGYFDI
ncbi:MAG: amino acid adenylation domain-containing protein [Oscillospiraceae bacterium]|nr:amino acid adenylation domain-containing protein [Oscillospiraceae bacterium]